MTSLYIWEEMSVFDYLPLLFVVIIIDIMLAIFVEICFIDLFSLFNLLY